MEPSEIQITAEPSGAHRLTCKFTLDRAIYPGGSAYFGSFGKALGSPLAESFFKHDDLDIAELLISENSVTVTLADGGATDWREAGPRVGALLRAHVGSQEPAVAADIKANLPDEQELRTAVQEVLDTQINPAVASHGGHVSLLDVRGNSVFVEFGGGCQGCGMVDVTLKHGVERAIRDRAPDVGEILDTTDHASGRNPYYAPSEK
jgi:Fe-S cluster biogenesis protein NfuA